MFVRNILSAVVAIATCISMQVDASDASKVLHGDDFKTSIASGATFVKFFSPQCGHCRRLAPTWEQMAVENQKLQMTKGFKIAEVDCLIEGDLCEENEIYSYPTMKLFYKGSLVDKYEGDRTIESLNTFVSTKADEYINLPAQVKPSEVGTVQINPAGSVVVLDTESYARRTAFGPWLVEYYAPWCGHCKALAPVYEEVAKELQGKVNVGKVDCTVNQEICKALKVRGYPTIMLHQHGESIEYAKQRSKEAITQFALGATEPNVKAISYADVPALKEKNDVNFIFSHSPSTDPATIDMIEKQSQVFYERVHLHSTTDKDLIDKLKVEIPSLVVLKDNRMYTYPGSLSDEAAVNTWIRASHTSLVTAITSANAGTVLNAPGNVMLGLFDPTKPTTHHARQALTEAAFAYNAKYNGKGPIRFAYMDATKWSSYVRGAFGVNEVNLPVIIVVNSKEELFYPHALDGRRVGLDEESLASFLENVDSGLIEPQSMLSYLQSVARKVQKKTVSATNFAKEHPFVAMLTGVAFTMALLRHFGSKETAGQPGTRAADGVKAD